MIDDTNIHNSVDHEANKPRLINGDMNDTSIIKELLVKQQEKSKELEERLKQLTHEWTIERVDLQKELKQADEIHEIAMRERDESYAKVEDEKRQLIEQYKSLLDKVATLKERMGEKLKADAVSTY